jgi:two-component system alkaline phosphatase synthesis response regulator PhoP
MESILLVEDDPDITKLLNLHFSRRSFRFTSCANGEEAMDKIANENFDLIMLDVTLPDINGMYLCKKLRESDVQAPIMMLTCRGEETDKVLALELGANDYMTKPFGILELTSRIQSLLRKEDKNPVPETAKKQAFSFKDLVIDFNKRKATIKGEQVELTTKEFDILALLSSYPGKTFSRHELLIQIWGVAFSGYEHTITSHINKVRLKIESDFRNPQYILTTWGKGYRFQE